MEVSDEASNNSESITQVSSDHLKDRVPKDNRSSEPPETNNVSGVCL